MNNNLIAKNNPVVNLVFYVIFICMVIPQIVSTNKQYNEYKTSEDIRNVEAEVVNLNIKHKDDKNIYTYDIQYTINNVKYQNKLLKTSNKGSVPPLKVGNIVTIEVYKDKSTGNYKIPTITSEKEKNARNMPMYIFIGIVVIAYIVQTLFFKKKKEEEQIK